MPSRCAASPTAPLPHRQKADAISRGLYHWSLVLMNAMESRRCTSSSPAETRRRCCDRGHMVGAPNNAILRHVRDDLTGGTRATVSTMTGRLRCFGLIGAALAALALAGPTPAVAATASERSIEVSELTITVNGRRIDGRATVIASVTTRSLVDTAACRISSRKCAVSWAESATSTERSRSGRRSRRTSPGPCGSWSARCPGRRRIRRRTAAS